MLYNNVTVPGHVQRLKLDDVSSIGGVTNMLTRCSCTSIPQRSSEPHNFRDEENVYKKPQQYKFGVNTSSIGENIGMIVHFPKLPWHYHKTNAFICYTVETHVALQ